MGNSDITTAAQSALSAGPDAVIPAGPSIAIAGATEQGTLLHNDPDPNSERHIQFADFHEQYTGRYIELADAKAGATFAVAAGILVYLLENESALKLIKTPTITFDFFVVASALVSLAASAALAFFVVAPRRSSSDADGFVFWGTVAGLNSASEFIQRATQATDSGLCAARLAHCYDLSRVCAKKYRFLVWSMRIGLAGVALTFIAVMTQ